MIWKNILFGVSFLTFVQLSFCEELTRVDTYYPEKEYAEFVFYQDGKKIAGFKNNHRTGIFDRWGSIPDGKMKFRSTGMKWHGEIHYKDGDQHGERTIYNEQGELIAIESYKDGKMDGTIKRFKNGRLASLEEFVMAKEVSRKEYFEDGRLKSERYSKDRKPNGVSRRYLEDGTIAFEGKWKEGKKEGLHLTRDKTGSRHEEFYKDGVIQKEIYTDADGHTYLVRDFNEGVERGYFNDGKLRKETKIKLVKGKRVAHGAHTDYYEGGGVRRRGTFKEGLPTGAESYDKSGRLRTKASFENGLPAGVQYFDRSGKPTEDLMELRDMVE